MKAIVNRQVSTTRDWRQVAPLKSIGDIQSGIGVSINEITDNKWWKGIYLHMQRKIHPCECIPIDLIQKAVQSRIV